ncbi:MAG: hypothetical protein FWD68_14420 [Alphaproteobacteria bacterium]|nr:hypothetical protein [Alphaproteobacteria bacterium]
MKFSIFGLRAASAPQIQPNPFPAGNDNRLPDHRPMPGRLLPEGAEQALARPHVVGRILFDMVRNILARNNRVRMEDLLAILASNGGYSCLLAALSDLSVMEPPPGPGPGIPRMVVVTHNNGHNYYFNELANFYLLKSEFSFLRLALGAAQHCDADIPFEMIQETIGHVAKTIGSDSEDFGVPRLPDEHLPGGLPINYVRILWPKFLDVLNSHEVPPTQWPIALGFALSHVIEAGRGAIDPTLAARITLECAIPMAKVDPERIAGNPD